MTYSIIIPCHALLHEHEQANPLHWGNGMERMGEEAAWKEAERKEGGSGRGLGGGSLLLWQHGMAWHALKRAAWRRHGAGMAAGSMAGSD